MWTLIRSFCLPEPTVDPHHFTTDSISLCQLDYKNHQKIRKKPDFRCGRHDFRNGGLPLETDENLCRKATLPLNNDTKFIGCVAEIVYMVLRVLKIDANRNTGSEFFYSPVFAYLGHSL